MALEWGVVVVDFHHPVLAGDMWDWVREIGWEMVDFQMVVNVEWAGKRMMISLDRRPDND